jgi:hypothetical protein
VVEIGVIHLVRRKNGIEPFKKFLDSYLEHPAGVPHDLVLIFKGFRGDRDIREYDELLKEIPHKRLFTGDYGFDVAPYFLAVKLLDYRYFCFLNSFSRILSEGWLARLRHWVGMDGVGLVGATGSYLSFATSNLERNHSLSSLGTLARLRWRIRHVFSEANLRLITLRASAWLLGTVGLWAPGRHFPTFPNYHIRTNAFMASRATLSLIRVWPMIFKLSAFLFESGHDSLTNQVIRLGLRPLVVTRDGNAYEKEQWHLSNTFRQAMQQDLLVADNQTHAYEKANGEGRIAMCRQVWGPFARPPLEA